MKYAFRFFKESSQIKSADEVIIRYNQKTVELIDFAKKMDEKQRLIVNITELENKEDSLNIFKGAAAAHPNFALLTSITDVNIIDYDEENIKFFFIEGASTVDELTGQLNLGVSDIYVINELGFSLKEVSKKCHDKNVQVRVFPNVAQSATELPTSNFKKFFVRPDDIFIYEEFVDVFEFFGNIKKQDVLYAIYKDEKWLGDLSVLILGLKEPVLNTAIMPYFGSIRSECHKRCSLGGKCDICGVIKSLAKKMEEKGMEIRHERKIDEDISENDSPETLEDIS